MPEVCRLYNAATATAATATRPPRPKLRLLPAPLSGALVAAVVAAAAVLLAAAIELDAAALLLDASLDAAADAELEAADDMELAALDAEAELIDIEEAEAEADAPEVEAAVEADATVVPVAPMMPKLGEKFMFEELVSSIISMVYWNELTDEAGIVKVADMEEAGMEPGGLLAERNGRGGCGRTGEDGAAFRSDLAVGLL